MAGLALTTLPGCSDRGPASPELAPPQAAPIGARGVFDLALSDAEVAIADSVGRDHGKLDVMRHRLSPSMSWQSLCEFYAQRLGDGWKVLTTYPENHAAFLLRAWEHPSLLGGGPVLVAAWFKETAVDAEGRLFRPLLVAASR
ncbi:hypothetical protein DZC73_28865 [Albitalea terrae]|uniref:Uncharacterized protein n=2 Tax=Piscinibacter terrae TaxID=2496871 RepID=A0A3N7HGW6_9BURK|nr:hypothetical protein DZC73_28865 [Albitalea terrae]